MLKSLILLCFFVSRGISERYLSGAGQMVEETMQSSDQAPFTEASSQNLFKIKSDRRQLQDASHTNTTTILQNGTFQFNQLGTWLLGSGDDTNTVNHSCIGKLSSNSVVSLWSQNYELNGQTTADILGSILYINDGDASFKCQLARWSSEA